MTELTTRNARLEDLVALLRDQQARKIDLVVPAAKVKAVDGNLVVKGIEPIVSDTGVTLADGTYVPTAVCDEGVAEKMQIPIGYLRRLRGERVDLYDSNVNGWLHGRRPKVRTSNAPFEGSEPTGRMLSENTPEHGATIREAIPGDSRSFLMRCFRGDDGFGIGRAFLSDRYARMDNLDVLSAALDGVREAGVEVNIDGADLTERRMVVRVRAPEVQSLAPTLLKGYRSPFTGDRGDENPTVFAGFQIANSETGDGAFSIVPRLVVQVCMNGMTMTHDAVRQVHLGGRLEHGVIQWSEDTEQQNVTLVKAKTRDAVRTFLDVDYMRLQIDKIEAQSDRPCESGDVRVLAPKVGVSASHLDGLLEHFLGAGQRTRGGLMQALTSYAQQVDDPDLAYTIENNALRALTVS